MRTNWLVLAWILGSGVLWLSGCAASRPVIALDPIGPSAGRSASVGSGDGYLEVFTATELRDSGGIAYWTHTSYAVYGTNGIKVRGVLNRIGDLDQKATVVDLPAGEYFVYAQSARFGRLKVPIVIATGRLTSVYLAEHGMPRLSDVPDGEYVRLPDGHIVGRRAAMRNPAAPGKR